MYHPRHHRPAFLPPIPFNLSPSNRPISLSPLCPPLASLSSNLPNLYTLLNLPPPSKTSIPTPSAIRTAYFTLAKTLHPDVSTAPTSTTTFDQIARAYAVLSDPALRRIYDKSGHEGLAAVQSIEERALQVKKKYAHMGGEELDYLSDTGQLIGALLTAGETAVEEEEGLVFPGRDTEVDDACPRSVEEAIWNIQFHSDVSVKYYGLWWIYKFKVSEAEDALVNVLKDSMERTALGGYGLRRRAALALGSVARRPDEGNKKTVIALGKALESEDYFLRYRAAEALANIGRRWGRGAVFPDGILNKLAEVLNEGRREIGKREEGKSGYFNQESLFELDRFEGEVRERLEKVFKERRQNEDRSRRTTMTPQLGVGQVGRDNDQPYEWILKAMSEICCCHGGESDVELVEVVKTYTKNEVPLVRYAACKALYAMTGEEGYAEEIVKGLDYGVEHHYSQRVLIRDLGDVGYCKGAGAVAQCGMVENSFKILALKNMLAKKGHDPTDPDVRNVLAHMDSLL